MDLQTGQYYEPQSENYPDQNNYQHDLKEKIKAKLKKDLTLGIILLLVLGIISIFIKRLQKDSDISLDSNSNETASEYSVDTDNDYIPNVIEAAVGLNPLVSEFTKCEVKSCESGDASAAIANKKNILVIIDSSGSMGLLINGKSKMDLAKDAVKRFVQSASTDINIGLMVYGQGGSNSTADKGISCQSSQIVAQIGSVNINTIDGYLSQIKPVGWTPIGLAIKNGQAAFIGKEGQKNQMIIVSDGAETCDTNPIQAAADAKASSYGIRVDVIGFAVNTQEQQSLEAISTSGGGLFSVAINADQLLSQMQASKENFDKFQDTSKCVARVYQESVACLQGCTTTVSNYLNNQLSKLTGAENTTLSNLRSEILLQYNRKINEVQDEWSAKNRENQQKFLNQ